MLKVRDLLMPEFTVEIPEATQTVYDEDGILFYTEAQLIKFARDHAQSVVDRMRQ